MSCPTVRKIKLSGKSDALKIEKMRLIKTLITVLTMFCGIFIALNTVTHASDQFPIPYSEAGYSAEVSTGSEVSYTSGTYHFAECPVRLSARLQLHSF